MASEISLRTIARGTPGFSGADLANLVNESALLAARKSKRIVTALEFEEARDKVLMGAEKRSMVQTEDDKKLTAYHEAGHAIVSLNEKADDPTSLLQNDSINAHFDEWLARLNDKQREVIERRFGLHGYENATLEQVAKGLGVTRERVRQIQMEALKRLRTILENEGYNVENIFE